MGAGTALHLASLMAVAVVFGRFGELVAERQRQAVLLLLTMPVAAAVLHGVLLSVQRDDWDAAVSPLTFMSALFVPSAVYAGSAGVLLGLTWLFTTQWVLERRSVRTGAYSD